MTIEEQYIQAVGSNQFGQFFKIHLLSCCSRFAIRMPTANLFPYFAPLRLAHE